MRTEQTATDSEMLDQVGSRVGAEKLVEACPYAHARIEQSKRFPTVRAVCQEDVI